MRGPPPAPIAPVLNPAVPDLPDYRRLLRRIIRAYDSLLVRAYCVVRFQIINLNMLHILSLCLRGRTRVLEVGCGFGLFGCYFAARDSRGLYHLRLDLGCPHAYLG